MQLAFESLPFLWQGTLLTIIFSAAVTALSLVIGVFFGVLSCYGPRPTRWAIHLYCDIIRGIPGLVLIFTVYYGLPLLLGFEINSYVAAVVALTVFSAAQVTEIARGAIQSIHYGQTEAGKAIGLGFWARVSYIVLPQALRRFLPPWINSVTDVVKGSALVSLVGIVDLMLSIQQVIGRVYEPMPLYVLGAIIYFLINYSLSSASRTLEARFAYIRE